MGNYRLHYFDIRNLASYMRKIGTKRIPHDFEEWNEATIMSIIDGNGSFLYVCDMTYPNLPLEVIENLAHALAAHWN